MTQIDKAVFVGAYIALYLVALVLSGLTAAGHIVWI